MLTISRKYVDQIRAATVPEDLYELLQNAITLELATIPPYLCAWFSLKPGTNGEIGEILRSIVIEEMLHMTIAGNLMIALGGTPRMADPASLPTYPGQLPMHVGNSVVARLRKCSIEQIEKVFMKIEEPEKPLKFPKKALKAVEFATIGEFYKALVAKLEELGDNAFKGNFANEVKVRSFGSDVLFPITDVASARKAIMDVIVVQGEGTSVSPQDAQGELAHYYRFQQIVVGKSLVKDSSVPQGWSFSGPPLTLDSANIWNMDDDPKTANYPAGSAARTAVDAFNKDYSDVLRGLDRAFNGNPGSIGSAIGAMYSLSDSAQAVLATPSPLGAGTQTGLPFEFVA